MKTLFIYGVLFVNIFTLGLTKSYTGNCQDYQLSGGSKSDEGILEVRFNHSWVHVCFNGTSTEDLEEICRLTTGNLVELQVYPYSDNVYRVPLQLRRISYQTCSTHNITSIDNSYRQCEKVLSICCHDAAAGTCSSTWNNTVWSPEFDEKRHKFKQLRYSEVISVNFTKIHTPIIMKSWTKSFLQDQNIQCETQEANINTDCRSHNCQSTCNVTSDPVFVMFCADNKTCCMTEDEYRDLQTKNCSIKNLTVFDASTHWNVTPQFCIAAEVINGTAFVSIEECSRFLQSFNVSEKLVPTTTTDKEQSITVSSTSVRNTTNTTESAKAIDTDNLTEPLNTVMILVIVVVSVLVAACVVFVAVIYRICRKIEKVREKQRPNSVANHGYAMEVFHQSRLNDEEYTLISDMELEHNSSEQFKPKLPDRDGESKHKNAQEVELITIAEYSVPSDNIREGCKISQTSDYCTTTYDDPIRLKLKEQLKNNDKNNCKDDSVHNDGSDLEIKESETNAEHLQRHSCNNEIVDIHGESATVDDGSATNCESTLPASEDINGKSVKTFQTKVNDDAYEDGFGPLKQNQVTETEESGNDDECELEGIESKCNDIDSCKDDDYEDSGVFDGKFNNKCSSGKLFEEHVCLACLKPEHLTKLGIKIITDDMYEKSKNVQRCLSEPVPRSYVNSANFDDPCCNEMSQNKSIERKDNASGEQEDRLQDLHFTRRNKTISNARRCSVCNTVYDRLGNMQPNVWTHCTDNVYDQFGNFKHFKHRNQIGGKRMNSN